MKLLIGGSPCTHWSIAQTKNRETEASGIGWELFLNYRIARDKYQPDYFLYENNKSMSSAIWAQITAELGVEPVLINSALVSAQNRQRLYWAGKRNPDGTYSQVPVELPEDRGILLRDILETKGALVVNALESWKSRTVDAHMGKLENNLVPRMNDPNPAKQQYDCIAEPLHVCAIDGEDAVLVDAEKNQTVRRSISDIVEKKGYLPEMFNPYNRAEVSEKAPTLSTGSMVTSSCAVLVVDGAVIKAAAPPMQVNEATKLGYTVIQPGECVDLAMPQSKTRRGRAMKDKTNCLTTSCDFYEYCGTLDAPIYQVRDGMITVKGQEYPIKLRDGCYIIRKLTVRGCGAARRRLSGPGRWLDLCRTYRRDLGGGGMKRTVKADYSRTCEGCRFLITEPWLNDIPSFRCGADGRCKGYIVGIERLLPYIPAWCPELKEN